MNFKRPQSTKFRLLPSATQLVASFIFACAVFGLPAFLEACPTCKEGIADGTNHANMVQGYFWSIVFMMSMPFLIFGGLGLYFYTQIRKAQGAAETVTEASAAATGDTVASA